MEERILRIMEECCEDILAYDGEDMVGEGVISSFTVLNLVNMLEEEFGIRISARFVRPKYFRNKESVIELVNEMLEEKSK